MGVVQRLHQRACRHQDQAQAQEGKEEAGKARKARGEEMTELLPCPFCGGGHIERNSDRWGHWYFCDCEARGGYGNSPAEAALRWNARAQPQSPSHQAVADALSLLSDLFSETAHETWTKGEVVEVIEDFAKLRCPDTRPLREGK
jgi:predicted RNA-binding Zn-ribbon protein involved in translation (DUF1610 family)